jgi:D-alanyl-D-alanine carboxypeptidase (penicillin-binding protein 5/6)
VASLFEALLMVSANDAAYALADAAGGYERTVELMNDTAAAVGAHDTVVVDPSGLDEDGQRTSAYDLALIGRDAMRLPAFRGYIVKRDAVFPGGRDPRTGTVHAAFHIANINGLLTHYPGAIGIKPGRTNRAQHTFIGAATRGGRTLIVAQMGSTTGSWKPSAALLDWGFANADRVSAVGHLVEPGEAGPPVPAPTPTAPDATPSVPAVPVATGTPVPAIASGAWSGRTADLGFAAAVLLTGGLLTGLVRAGWRRRRGRA